MGTSFQLEPDDRTLHGSFRCDYPPVLTIDPGDWVRLRTRDRGGSTGPYVGDRGRRATVCPAVPPG